MPEGSSGPSRAEMGLRESDLGIKKQEQPGFIKHFTKKHSAEDRTRLAGEIKSARGGYWGREKELRDREQKLTEEAAASEVDLKKQAERLQQLEEQLARLSGPSFKKAWNFFKIRGLKPQVKLTEQGIEQAQQGAATQKTQLEEVTSELIAPGVPQEFVKAKGMVDAFYGLQKEKWAQIPYDKEDLTYYFSEGHLARLTLAEYGLLLRRFPGEMVTHVTRQGIRDHLGHGDHTLGLDGYASGFIEALRDGRIKSPFGIHIEEGLKEEAVEKCLGLGIFNHSREDAEHYLNSILQPTGQGSYADRMSVHFATEMVADFFYGSEKGNEIFFAFPAAFIASQFYFMASSLTEGDSSYWNDQWVLSRDGQGLDLNSGLVFIPRESLVDAKTGSRYKMDEELKPTVNKRFVDTIVGFTQPDEFDQFSDQVIKLSTAHQERINDIVSRKLYDMTDQYSYRETQRKIADFRAEVESGVSSELTESLKPYVEVLRDRFGITDLLLMDTLIDAKVLDRMKRGKDGIQKGYKDPYGEPIKLEDYAADCLRERAILFELAENPIASEQFWERYFAENPQQRPSKIVYYSGEDPTLALRRWKEENGVINRGQGRQDRFGFEEHYVSGVEEQGIGALIQEVTGFEPTRFESIAREVINKYFPEKKKGNRKRKNS